MRSLVGSNLNIMGKKKVFMKELYEKKDEEHIFSLYRRGNELTGEISVVLSVDNCVNTTDVPNIL